MFVATSRGSGPRAQRGWSSGGRSVRARSGAAINAVFVHGVAPVLGDEGVPTLGSTAIMRDARTRGSPILRTVWRSGQTRVGAHPGRGWCRKRYKKFVSLIQTTKLKVTRPTCFAYVLPHRHRTVV